jgi:signal transduction histidine kinase
MRVLKIIILLITVSLSCHAQFSQRKASVLRDSMFYYYYRSDSCNFQRFANDYKSYLLRYNMMYMYYNAMSNEVLFYLNAFDYFTAYVKMQEMGEDIKKRNCPEEQYQYTNMMGNVLADLGKREQGMVYLLKTIDLINKYCPDKNRLVGVYMDIAYCQMQRHPDKALQWAHKALKVSQDTNNIADATALIAQLNFILKNYPEFQKYYKKYLVFKEKGYQSMYENYIMVYWLLYHHRTAEAIAKAKDMQNKYDRCYYLMKIYEFNGDMQLAYDEQTQLTEVSDSLMSSIMGNIIYNRYTERQLNMEHQTSIKHWEMFITLLLVCSTLFCFSLIIVLIVRKSIMRKLRQSNAELVVARDKAMESDKMKLAFIRNVSHQIRTPLNIISGYSQVLGKNNSMDDEARTKAVAKVEENVEKITDIFDKLLDVSDSESESQDEIDNLTTNQFLSGFLASYEGRQHPGVVLQFESELDATDEVAVHVESLKKILTELLDNAIKFTNQGTVMLQAKRDDTLQLVIVVQDTGCGIPSSENEHIFERFVKLDDFAEGTGLGLSLCRTLAKLLGGTIVLDNAYICGARFILRIPC